MGVIILLPHDLLPEEAVVVVVLVLVGPLLAEEAADVLLEVGRGGVHDGRILMEYDSIDIGILPKTICGSIKIIGGSSPSPSCTPL